MSKQNKLLQDISSDRLGSYTHKHWIIIILVEEYPNCPQATLASGVPHPESHIDPHLLLWHISTRPFDLNGVDAWFLSNLRAPSVQVDDDAESNGILSIN